MNHHRLLAVAVIVLFSRPGFGQARSVSVPAEPSLLNLTTSWSRASTLGDLRQLRTRPDHIELRVWRGYGPSETQAIVVRRTDGHWSAFLGRVVRCEIQIATSVGDTASEATMRRYAAEARSKCGVSVANAGRARESLQLIRSSCSHSLFRSRKSRWRGRRQSVQACFNCLHG
jgi:hypothetical protein